METLDLIGIIERFIYCYDEIPKIVLLVYVSIFHLLNTKIFMWKGNREKENFSKTKIKDATLHTHYTYFSSSECHVSLSS